MPCGLRLARVVALRWPDHVAPPCAVLGVVRLRLVAMAVRPYVALMEMSQCEAVTAGPIMAVGTVRVLLLPVLRWGRRRVPQPHRRPITPVIRTIIRRLINRLRK